VPLVTVTVTLYRPGAVVPELLMVSVDETVPPDGIATLFGFSDKVRPEGDAVAASEAVPENPPMLETPIVAVAELPAAMSAYAGLAEILNAMTFMLAMYVDQTPPVVETYSPATHTWLGFDGSTPAPK